MTKEFLSDLNNGICTKDICGILLQRYDYLTSDEERQIILHFITTDEFWERFLKDSDHHHLLHLFTISELRSRLTAEHETSLLKSNIDFITCDMTSMKSNLIFIDTGLDRWRQSIVKSFNTDHIVNAELLAKRSHLLLLIMYQSPDYAFQQVQRIVQETGRISNSSPARFIAISNSAVIMSYLQQFRQAFAILNNIQSCEYHYLTTSAQIQSNRGLLQEYMSTLQTLLQYSRSIGTLDTEIDTLLKLVQCRIEMNQFHEVSILLLRVEVHLESFKKPAFLVRFLISLSKCYDSSGNYVIARDILYGCYQIADKHLLGSDRIFLIRALENLAELYLNRFKQAKSAIHLLQLAIEELQKIHDSDSNDRYMISLLRRLSRALLETGKSEFADRILRLSVIRAQSLMDSKSANMFEISAFVEIATSYSQLGESKRSSEIWTQAWNRICSSSSLYRTYDCLTIAWNYCNHVQEPERLLKVLQTASHYSTVIYTEQHKIPAEIQIRIANIYIESRRYDQAETILNDLHLQLNSSSHTRNSDGHVRCWTVEAQLLYQSRRYLDLKSLLDDYIWRLENEPICLPIISPGTLFDVFAAQIRVNQKLCEFTDTNRVIERAKTICERFYSDSVEGHIILRNISCLFARMHRFDLAKVVIIEAWESCKFMAFHEQYLQSDSLQIRNKTWFLEFVQSTVIYSNILGQDNMIGLAFRALQDALEILVQLTECDRDDLQDLIFKVRQAQAHLMFKGRDDSEERIILLEMLKFTERKHPLQSAVIYCRLASIKHRCGDEQQRLHFLKLALTTLMMTDDQKGRWLLRVVKRALRRKKSIEFNRMSNLDLYDFESYLPETKDQVMLLPDNIHAEQLYCNRQHILQQLHLYEQSSVIPHDYIAMTLIQLAQAYIDERIFSEAATCLSRAKSVIKSRQLRIKIPDLQFNLKSDPKLNRRCNQQATNLKPNRTIKTKKKLNKITGWPYLKAS